MDIKGKLERHLTGRLASLGGEVDKIPFARAIYKACDSKDQAPKTKHIRHILFTPPPSPSPFSCSSSESLWLRYLSLAARLSVVP
jgi:hypothetical protein